MDLLYWKLENTRMNIRRKTKGEKRDEWRAKNKKKPENPVPSRAASSSPVPPRPTHRSRSTLVIHNTSRFGAISIYIQVGSNPPVTLKKRSALVDESRRQKKRERAGWNGKPRPSIHLFSSALHPRAVGPKRRKRHVLRCQSPLAGCGHISFLCNKYTNTQDTEASIIRAKLSCLRTPTLIRDKKKY
jgi:hypothetical protein